MGNKGWNQDLNTSHMAKPLRERRRKVDRDIRKADNQKKQGRVILF